MLSRGVFILAVACLGMASSFITHSTSQASLYHTEEPGLTLAANDDGVGEALPFDEFRRRLAVLANVANSDPNADDRVREDRKRVLDRVNHLKHISNPSWQETVSLALDVMHLGQSTQGVLDQLIPLARLRPNYYVLTTLAHLYGSAEGDWANAINYLETALLDYTPPPPVSGLTTGQQKWQVRLDREYLLPLFRLNLREADPRYRPNPETDTGLPLFRSPDGEPVRFVDETGEFTPGRLAEAEREKLPSDAVAIVQQLLLWFPGDSRLYWLLADLYAVQGDLSWADKLYDELSWGRKFANRRLMMDHRAAVKAALQAERQAADEEAQRAFPLSWRTISLYFLIVAFVVAVAAYRSLCRSFRRGATCRR